MRAFTVLICSAITLLGIGLLILAGDPETPAASESLHEPAAVTDAAADTGSVSTVTRQAASADAATLQVFMATERGEKPLPNARLSVAAKDNRDGWFSPERSPAGFLLEPGDYQVRAEAPGLPSRLMDVHCTAGQPTRVVLHPLTAVTVKFVDDRGRPVPGVRALLLTRPEDEPGPNQCVSSSVAEAAIVERAADANGCIRWTRIPAFVDYRYAVVSGHQVVCDPVGPIPTRPVSGDLRPDRSELHLCATVAGGRIVGRLPLPGSATAVSIDLYRISERKQPDSSVWDGKSYLAGRAFEQVAHAIAHPDVDHGAFCFASVEPGHYRIKARWHDEGTRTFVAAVAELKDATAVAELGTLQPLSSPPVLVSARLVDGSGRALPFGSGAKGKVEVSIETPHDIYSVDELHRWISDTIELEVGENVAIRGLPEGACLLQADRVALELEAGWRTTVDETISKVVMFEDRHTEQVFDLACTKTVRVEFVANVPVGFTPVRAALMVADAGGKRRGRLAMQHDRRRGCVRATVSMPAGNYAAYVRLESRDSVLAGVVSTVKADGFEQPVEVTLRECPSAVFRIRGGQSLAGKTVDFAPSEFPYPIDHARVTADGRLIARGLPAGHGVDCYGLPAGTELEAVSGGRAVALR